MSIHISHRWEDLSHHGSPDYFCAFCNCSKRSQEATMPCSKAVECLEREAEAREQSERHELRSILADMRRFQYLLHRHGDHESVRQYGHEVALALALLKHSRE